MIVQDFSFASAFGEAADTDARGERTGLLDRPPLT